VADNLTAEQRHALAAVDGFLKESVQRYADAGNATGALGVVGLRERLAASFPFLREAPADG
jgi:hypothetical protein